MTKGQLERQIKTVLQADEQSRNSDIRLTQVLWFKFYPTYLLQRGGAVYVDITKLYELPREDNIKRIRAKIQNVDHEFVPTSAEVAKKRGWNIDEWKSYLGYPIKGEPSRRAIATNAELDQQMQHSLQKDEKNDEKSDTENPSLFDSTSLVAPPTRRPNGFDTH